MERLGCDSDDVYCHFQNKNNIDDNSSYTWNNWVKVSQILNSIAFQLDIPDGINLIGNYGGAIWLTANGNICYRFSPFGKVHTASIVKINLLFSSFLNFNFKITHTVPKPMMWGDEIQKSKDENQVTISINQLSLLEAEKFNPHSLIR